MRTAVIKSSRLSNNDWNAERYVPIAPGVLNAAKLAGWEAGTRGTAKPRGKYSNHCRTRVRNVFWKAHKDGLLAREKYIGSSKRTK